MITTAATHHTRLPLTPVGFAHPLSADQVMTAIRHAQRQGEDSYVLFNGFTIGATFTTRANVEAMISGTEPWPGSFQPGLHASQCRIFSVNAIGGVYEVRKP